MRERSSSSSGLDVGALSMTVVRFELLIEGKVQGVFFRQSALAQAQRLGLVGFVKNLTTGQVEAVCEGELSACEAFAHWCHQGPPSARVDHLRLTRAQPSLGFTDFRVEH